MSEDTAVEMFVGGLLLDPNTQAPVVVLKDESGNVHLPIWIGIAEATSIASVLKQLSMARPLTHDLMYDVFVEMGLKVQRVVITDLRDSTYFAELIMSIGDKAIIMDCRPSDAIALVLRASAPIFVTQRVLEQAKISFSVVVGEGEGEGEGAAEEGEGEVTLRGPKGQDFKQIDKEKWNEILEELDAEDFKYKM